MKLVKHMADPVYLFPDAEIDGLLIMVRWPLCSWI